MRWMLGEYKRILEALIDWTMDRTFNPKGYYDDGMLFRTFEELRNRPFRGKANKC